MLVVVYFSLAVLLVYLIICILFIFHWNKTKSFQCDSNKTISTSISVIVPVRNEAEHIQACIESLLSQNYPTELFEIIVVDDQSYDETPDILEKLENPNLKTMRLGVERRTTIEGSKKKAISYGVNHAQGKLIVTTDGDCELPSNWLLTIAQFYEEYNPRLIVGPVQLDRSKGLFHLFQSLDVMSSFFLHVAGISSSLSYLCSGANLAYEKKYFLELNPYDNNLHIPSGDDVFLIQKFKKQYPDHIRALKSVDAICTTHSQPDLKSFMSQRLRWSSKMKRTTNFSTLIVASIIWLQKVFPWIILILSFILQNQIAVIVSSSIILCQYILDFIILYSATSFFKKTKTLWYFIPVEFLHTIYYSILGVLSWIPMKLEWKDRKI